MRAPIFAIALFLVACPKPEVAVDQDAAFWTWVTKEEVRLAEATKSDPVAVMNEIQAKLVAAQPGLIAEIALDPTEGEPQTLVVSADGDKKYFAAAQALVSSAPKLGRWKVVAFRQRRPAQDIEINGQNHSVGDFYFKDAGRQPGKIDVDIFVKGLDDANKQALFQVAFLMLDAILGEHDVETKIGAIELKALPDGTAGLKPLTDLPAVVDAISNP